MKALGTTKSEWKRRAWKVWPSAAWIHGEGPYALVAPCGRGTTVSLWPTEEEAKSQKAVIDESGCGGNCVRWEHRILDLRDIRKCWLPDKPASTTTIRAKERKDKCCVPFCRHKAEYAVTAKESFLRILGEPGPYSRCPLICRKHADDYDVLRDRDEPPQEGIALKPLRIPPASGTLPRTAQRQGGAR